MDVWAFAELWAEVFVGRRRTRGASFRRVSCSHGLCEDNLGKALARAREAEVQRTGRAQETASVSHKLHLVAKRGRKRKPSRPRLQHFLYNSRVLLFAFADAKIRQRARGMLRGRALCWYE